jgi:hypothetical protein
MPVKQADYEILLAELSSRRGAIALLKQYRPYLETLPSTRRPEQSLIAIPLPIVRLRQSADRGRQSFNVSSPSATTPLACDLAILTCDPEWKIKMGVEILIFIHRPQEDFSHLLNRWRQTQVYLDGDYEWLMPLDEQHLFSEAAEKICPLFVVFEETPKRIKQGLASASLPFILKPAKVIPNEAITQIVSTQD